jgi:hypothetical protein
MAKKKTSKSSRGSGGSGKRGARAPKAGSTPAASTKRQNAPSARPGRPSKKTLAGLERVQDELTRSLGKQVQLDMRSPPAGKGRTPWVVVGKLKGFQTDYETLSKALAQLDAQAGKLGKRRLARVRVTYRGVKKAGRRERTSREWTIGEIAPLDVALSRSSTALLDAWDDYGADSISPSSATELEIWLSDEEANDTGEF